MYLRVIFLYFSLYPNLVDIRISRESKKFSKRAAPSVAYEDVAFRSADAPPVPELTNLTSEVCTLCSKKEVLLCKLLSVTEGQLSVNWETDYVHLHRLYFEVLTAEVSMILWMSVRWYFCCRQWIFSNVWPFLLEKKYAAFDVYLFCSQLTLC